MPPKTTMETDEMKPQGGGKEARPTPIAATRARPPMTPATPPGMKISAKISKRPEASKAAYQKRGLMLMAGRIACVRGVLQKVFSGGPGRRRTLPRRGGAC